MCCRLVAVSPISIVPKGGGESKFTPPPPGSDGLWWWGVWHFERYRLGELYEFLWRFLPIPFVDETGMEGPFDFDLNMGKYRDYYEPPTLAAVRTWPCLESGDARGRAQTGAKTTSG